MPATVADLLGLLDLTPAGADRFVGRQPATSLQRVFGGEVAAQALTAATSTVPDREPGSTPVVHSLHAYFLRPGQTSKPITYEVERMRDGRAFATRRVQASQDDVPIFLAIVSFHVPEPGFTHADAMPDVPPASECPTLGDILAGVSGRDPRAFLAEWDALDCGSGPLASCRPIPPCMPASSPAPPTSPCSGPRWCRTAPTSGRPDCWSPRSTTRCGSTARLGFVTGRLFSAEGALIASVAQEGLLRQAGSTRSA